MMSRVVHIGNVPVGGGHIVSIQSMTNTRTADVAGSLAQIQTLSHAGCQIIRLAVPDAESAEALREIVEKSPIPVIADIHFDSRLALRAIESGVHALRLNPGNLNSEAEVRKIAECAGEHGITIRVGANSGSVNADFLRSLEKQLGNFDDAMSEALVQSVLEQCRMLEKYHFNQIKVSLKSSSVPITIRACRRFHSVADYPQHIGVTEAGTPRRGMLKSACGLAPLLLDHIGDTLRVSLSADPLQEVLCAKTILECCGLREAMPELISCPTCGRTQIDLISLAEKVEDLVSSIKNSGRHIPFRKIAVMGCIVNGPGEAREADLGLAGGNQKIAVFQFGKVIGTYPESQAFQVLQQLLESAANKVDSP